MGKGRQLAGVIANNWRLGRKRHVWISCSGDLVEDAKRDLRDLRLGKIQVVDLKDWKNDTAVDLQEGVIFATYNLITQKKRGDKNKFVRVEQLVKWCGGEGYEGCLFFDEAHKAKNLYPTAGKDGRYCVEIKILQRVRAASSRRPPRHRRDAYSMAWRCRFLSTRRTG